MFNTPGGRFASIQAFENKNAVNGVSSDGFAITQLPDTSAGAIFHVNKYRGRFHGDIVPT